MSFSNNSNNWPEYARRFVYTAQPIKVSELVFEQCLQPAVQATVRNLEGSDAALAFGLGGEITRYSYWQGNLQACGEPPLDYNQARELVMGYSVFSEEVQSRGLIVVALIGSVSCGYKKGFIKELGEII